MMHERAAADTKYPMYGENFFEKALDKYPGRVYNDNTHRGYIGVKPKGEGSNEPA